MTITEKINTVVEDEAQADEVMEFVRTLNPDERRTLRDFIHGAKFARNFYASDKRQQLQNGSPNTGNKECGQDQAHTPQRGTVGSNSREIEKGKSREKNADCT